MQTDFSQVEMEQFSMLAALDAARWLVAAGDRDAARVQFDRAAAVAERYGAPFAWFCFEQFALQQAIASSSPAVR